MSFKQYLKEQAGNVPAYVTVRNGRVELRRMDVMGVVATFAQGAVAAVIQANTIVVNLKNGKIVLYKLSSSGNSVSGPYSRG
jgi:hypothetical protein